MTSKMSPISLQWFSNRIDPLHVCRNAANLEDKPKEIFASVKKSHCSVVQIGCTPTACKGSIVYMQLGASWSLRIWHILRKTHEIFEWSRIHISPVLGLREEETLTFQASIQIFRWSVSRKNGNWTRVRTNKREKHHKAFTPESPPRTIPSRLTFYFLISQEGGILVKTIHWNERSLGRLTWDSVLFRVTCQSHVSHMVEILRGVG